VCSLLELSSTLGGRILLDDDALIDERHLARELDATAPHHQLRRPMDW
jgi:hypothetical protein